jgi:DNA-binding NarL/FixJ family response regulator
VIEREEKPIRSKMKRILIVEDNAYFMQFLKETLHARLPSLEILEAKNAEEALQRMENLSPDTIFADLRLPGANGLVLTQEIKAKCPSTVVVIITNYDLPEYREAAYQAGADHFLSKDSFLKMINSIPSNEKLDQEGSTSNGSP